jgi:hypothetical protein
LKDSLSDFYTSSDVGKWETLNEKRRTTNIALAQWVRRAAPPPPPLHEYEMSASPILVSKDFATHRRERGAASNRHTPRV